MFLRPRQPQAPPPIRPIPCQRVPLINPRREGTTVHVWVRPQGVTVLVKFKYIPPQQERVGGTEPGMDPIEEGGIGHQCLNDDVVIVAVINVNVGVAAKSAISASDPVPILVPILAPILPRRHRGRRDPLPSPPSLPLIQTPKENPFAHWRKCHN